MSQNKESLNRQSNNKLSIVLLYVQNYFEQVQIVLDWAKSFGYGSKGKI